MSEAHVRGDMRKYSRRAVELPVLVSDSANRIRAGIRLDATEISAGGAFLRSDLLFEVGELLHLQIDLGPGKRLFAVGRVMRVSRGEPPERVPGMGIEFVDLSSADRVALESLLR